MKEKCIYLNDIQKMVRMNKSQNDNLNSEINDIFKSLLKRYINEQPTYGRLINLQKQYRNKENIWS